MKQDIIIAGVGGQGILSIAFVIDNAAQREGLNFKQAEVHGMAQRGGAVQSHLRLSSEKIYSDLIPKGEADIILSVEPLETCRYLDYLSSEGIIVSSSSPYKNIPNYPDLSGILKTIQRIENSIIIDAERLAKEAGFSKSQNMVVLGAASPHLMTRLEDLLATIKILFKPRGKRIVEINLKAFDLGRKAASS